MSYRWLLRFSPTYHLLRTNFPVFLDIPKAQSAVIRASEDVAIRLTSGSPDSRSHGLREAEIRIVQKRELELVILTNGYKCAGGI